MVDGGDAMDVVIYQNGEKKGRIPYSSLLFFQQLCHHAGFRTQWDSRDRKLHLVAGLQNRKVYLAFDPEDKDLFNIMEKTEGFLAGTGADLLHLKGNASQPYQGDVCLRVALERIRSNTPRVHILHTPGPGGQTWAHAFRKEFRTGGFTVRVKTHPKQRSPLPVVELRCQLLEGKNSEEEVRERIALILASALFRGLTGDHPLAVLPYLSPECLQHFLPVPPHKASGTEEVSKAGEVAAAFVDADLAASQKPDASEESPLPAPTRQAEVYFDYQLLIPESEESPYLILGNMLIKNTGNMDLLNPVICLQATPADGVQVKGRIIPPKMVDALGVQSADGNSATGWQYMEDDWFQQAKERGEYWIRPIRHLRISPGETETFSNFQINISKPEKGGTVMVQGVVFFNDKDLRFPSNNRVMISF
jgi:hypothetical protein